MNSSAGTPFRRALSAWVAAQLAGLTFCAAAAAAPRAPEAISPGESRRIPTIAENCPTFRWKVPISGGAFELVLWRTFEYEIEELALDTTPVLSRLLPASATSWTPTGADCLERKEIYAWSVREVPGTPSAGGAPPEGSRPSDWSALLYFRVGDA
jgi:hypothetical protein